MDSLPKLNKPQALQHMLSVHPSIFIHLDSRRGGVMLPKSLMGVASVVLELGLHLVKPITDLAYDKDGWSGTLSFGGRPFFCVVPWNAVYLVISADRIGYHWQDDTPPEIMEQHAAAALKAKQTTKAEAKSAKSTRERWTALGWGVIDGGKKDVAAVAEDEDEEGEDGESA